MNILAMFLVVEPQIWKVLDASATLFPKWRMMGHNMAGLVPIPFCRVQVVSLVKFLKGAGVLKLGGDDSVPGIAASTAAAPSKVRRNCALEGMCLRQLLPMWKRSYYNATGRPNLC